MPQTIPSACRSPAVAAGRSVRRGRQSAIQRRPSSLLSIEGRHRHCQLPDACWFAATLCRTPLRTAPGLGSVVKIRAETRIFHYSSHSQRQLANRRELPLLATSKRSSENRPRTSRFSLSIQIPSPRRAVARYPPAVNRRRQRMPSTSHRRRKPPVGLSSPSLAFDTRRLIPKAFACRPPAVNRRPFRSFLRKNASVGDFQRHQKIFSVRF